MHLLLDGHDLLATTSTLRLGHLWLQDSHEIVVITLVQYIQEFLNDVVTIVVPDKAGEHPFAFTSVAPNDDVENLSSPGISCMSQTLLNDVTGKFVLAVSLKTLDDEI